MDTLTAVIGISLFVFVAVAIAALIRALAGDTEDSGLATLLAPIVSSWSNDRTPVVREAEPTPWRFGTFSTRGSAA